RIEHTRLSIHCTNPLMLFTFMQIIDKAGINGQNSLDTRGLLLQEYVAQIIDGELSKAEWKAIGLTKEDVLQFLSEIACAARWANDRNAIDLVPAAKRKSKSRRKELTDEDIASDLFYWLDDNPAQGPLLAGSEAESGLFHTGLDRENFVQLLQFARAIELIVVSSYGVVGFRHELLAEYFVAQYFYSMDGRQTRTLPIRQELLEDVGKWGEPVALWAGLSEKPLELANRIAQLGQQYPDYVTEALMLSLVCISVEWHPPQSNLARPFDLPQTVKEILAEVVKKPERRTQVAALFDRCAAEGGVEIYHALLSLLAVPGIDRLFMLLNPRIVPDLLFTHLEHSIHALHYQAHIKPLEKILGAFGHKIGSEIIGQAAELSQDMPQQDMRLRISAVKILGYTHHQQAVGPLIALLSEPQQDIRDAAAKSLARLGPDLILDRLFKELMDYAMVPFIYEKHWTALRILYTFLKEPDPRYQLKDVRYQQVLEILITVLSANYLPSIQEYAQKILIDQGSETNSRQEKVLRLLVEQLASIIPGIGDNVVLILQGIGQAATPYLLDQLKRQPAEIVRLHSIAIFDHVRDPRALDALLSLVADQSQEVFYQVKLALHHYAQQPGCIAGVIKLVLYHTRDYVAFRAAEILEGFAEVAVEEIIQALPQIVSGRTILLVRVLEHVHDDKALPALITLLATSQMRNDIPLTSAIVHALGKFKDERVIAPLLHVVDDADPQLSGEAVKALTSLDELAFDDLIAALDVEHETIATPRIRQALLEMDPFPGEKLFRILTRHNEALNRQIRTIFLEKGFEAARVLVQHVLYPEQRVRGDVLRTLYAMDRFAVIPAFVEKLHTPPPEFLRIADEYLQQYDDAIPPLVSRLSNAATVDAATSILLGMSSRILPFMIVGLNDLDTRRQSQQIIKILGRQQLEILPDILGLFALIATKGQQQHAREALIDLLANDFADIILPSLLGALENSDLVKDIADVLLILARRHETKDIVLHSLVQALEEDSKKRNGAEQALIRLESLAVNPVSDLLAHHNQEVAQAAQRILLKIGIPALPAIWSLQSDARYPTRQAAARKILYAMPTPLLQEKLLELLASDDATNIEMALTLLLELIQNDAQRPPGNQAMIPALLAHLQTNVTERTSLRIIALLLLLDSSSVVDHLIQALRQYPHHDQRLVQAFLFLRKETVEETLQKLLERNSNISLELQAELIGVLGMVQLSPIVDEFAKKSGYYGLTAGGGHIYDPKYLAIALRALGGLLVSGHWDIGRLESLRLMYKGKTGNMQFDHKPESELFDILLGDLYAPRLKKLHEQLTREVAAHDQDIRDLQKQYNRIQGLEDDLQEANAALRRAQGEVIKLTNENRNLKNRLN
ncbi:MAG TPA: HEAT repeat domain-containing protein, partial [Ktedonobacteraceae bacterium]|nr:HEAT repeat domain-containing protein [Ktedonobacteraceae bacterium]